MTNSVLNSGQRRLNLKDLTEQVAKLCAQFDCPEPGIFLAHIMAGLDPRNTNALYRLLRQLDKRNKGKAPNQKDWERITDLLDLMPNFDSVDLGTSIEAAKQLMQFLYPKQKTIEVSGQMGTVVAKMDKPTKKEFREFLETFDKDF